MVGHRWAHFLAGLVLAGLLGGMTFFVLAGGGVQASAVNLLRNPSFEEDADGNGLPDGWKAEWQWVASPNRVVLDDQVKHGGARSLRVDLVDPAAPPTWGGRLYQDVPVVGGATYRFHGWIKLSKWLSAGEKEGLGFRAWMQYKDGTWDDIPIYLTDELFEGDFDWKEFTTTVTVPADVKTFRIALWSNAGTGTLWWDDLEFVKAEP